MPIRALSNSRMAVLAFAVLVLCSCGSGTPDGSGGSEAVAEQSPPSIVGVWAFVSETNMETGALIRDDSTWSGIWVFTDAYHCLARMQNDRVARTDDELAALDPVQQVGHYEQLLDYSSTAGTYTVEGDTLRRQWQISLGPGIIGLESVATYAVEDAGNRLVVDLPRRSADSGPAVRVVYRRLE